MAADVTPIRPGAPRKAHPLLEAGRSGDRLAILKASLDLALQTLAKPDCADYVKDKLITKVQSLTADIERIEDEREQAAHATDDATTEDQDWDGTFG